MIEWDSHMQNNQFVQILKVAIPFLDVDIGEKIDLEGLLHAIYKCTCSRERPMLDMILQLFQMERMMQMMEVFQTVQNATGANQTDHPEDMFEILKAMIPPEQQENMEMMFSMMEMMNGNTDTASDQENEQK